MEKRIVFWVFVIFGALLFSNLSFAGSHCDLDFEFLIGSPIEVPPITRVVQWSLDSDLTLLLHYMENSKERYVQGLCRSITADDVSPTSIVIETPHDSRQYALAFEEPVEVDFDDDEVLDVKFTLLGVDISNNMATLRVSNLFPSVEEEGENDVFTGRPEKEEQLAPSMSPAKAVLDPVYIAATGAASFLVVMFFVLVVVNIRKH